MLPTELQRAVRISDDGERVALIYRTRDLEARVGIFTRPRAEIVSAETASANETILGADGLTLAHLEYCLGRTSFCPAVLRERTSAPTSVRSPSGRIAMQIVGAATRDLTARPRPHPPKTKRLRR